ncbi:MAG TPA: addiction module protein [Chthoniobacteraceae bacterium]|nr:addiction module protein [Chthoniobacteraceae bacterium]
MTSELLEKAKQLPVAERVALMNEIWESLTAEGYEPDVTPEEAAELERRWQEHLAHPESAIPWEQVKAELEAKFGRFS